jgi:alkylated DNA repair dioxygenase AlkB
MLDLMAIIMSACGLASREDWPDSCNMNYYLDGTMSVGWHADDEVLFQGTVRDIMIISLSLGASRRFDLRMKRPTIGEQTSLSIRLNDGDILTMEGRCQKYMEHRIPCDKGIVGPRVNLTWRWIVKHTRGCLSTR